MRSSTPSGRRGIRRAALAVAASTCVALLSIPTTAAWAESPPDAPALVAPADGSTATQADPALRVSVSDPDGDPLSVRFEGRRKGATVPLPGAGEPFTIVAIPDIQNYTNAARGDIIRQQAQWVVDTRASLNTQFVVQLGDLVSSWDFAGHWPYASNGLKVLDDNGVPNAVVPGNHDFDNATGTHIPYDTWFPPSRYQNATWTPASARYGGYMGQDQFGDDPDDRGNMNNYSLFSAGGRDWIALGLEWEASARVLEWADRVLAAHPDRDVVMFTHAFVNLPGSRRTVAQRPGGTPPETTWQTFVRTHCQVRLVLNGHEHNGDLGEARRSDPNACGEPVQQILTDYQGRTNGGNGWLRYYTFDPAADTVTATTYSPYLNQYETDADSSFTLPFAFSEQEPAPFTTISTTTPTAGTATATWTGLQRDTEYEWRAVVSDGTASTTSATWTVRTPPDDVLFRDDFTRTVTGGWGKAPSGQSWTTTAPASAMSVDGNWARMLVPPGNRRNQALATTSFSDASFATAFSVTPAVTGSGTYATLFTRFTAASDFRATVQFRASGAPNVTLVRRVGSTETVLATYRMTTTPAPGEPVNLRFEVVGTSPATLRAKAWTGTAEPAPWNATATDASGQVAASGTLGYSNYVSGASTATSTVGVDHLTVTRIGAAPPPPPPPPNTPPTAAIAITTQSERSVALSGAGSTDADGTIASWAWNYGDSTTGTGQTTSHTYAQDGTYTVTLTVTDDDGATTTATKAVTVTTTPPPPPPPGTPLAADAFARTQSGGWGVADTGGSWTTSGAASIYSVQSGQGRQTLSTKGSTAASTLAGVAVRNALLRVDISWSRTPAEGAFYAAASPRYVASGTDYRCSLYIGSSGKPKVDLIRRVNGMETLLTSVSLPAVTLTPGAAHRLLCQTLTTPTGSTEIAAKFFPAGGAEPAAWQVRTTDATAGLQTSGKVMLWSYLSSSSTAGITTAWDDFSVTSLTP